MTALERDSEDRFVHWLAGHGFKAWKLRIDGQDGFPDRTVVTDRGVAFFEFKRPGEPLRRRQVKVVQELLELDAAVFVAFSFQEAKDKFNEWYQSQNARQHRLGVAIRALVDIRKSVAEQVAEVFPAGTRVRRNTTGVCGVVHSFSEGFPEQLGILLGNGNVWYYPVNELEPI